MSQCKTEKKDNKTLPTISIAARSHETIEIAKNRPEISIIKQDEDDVKYYVNRKNYPETQKLIAQSMNSSIRYWCVLRV